MNDLGDERRAWLAEGNARQARKRVAAKALIRDEAGSVLLVNPTYKEHWDLPGGMAEANEPPTRALEREMAEELGIHITAGRLLALDWVGPHGPWDDQLTFLFDGGILSRTQVADLSISDDEISAFDFFGLSEAAGLLRGDLADRLRRAIPLLGTDRIEYVETEEPRRPRRGEGSHEG